MDVIVVVFGIIVIISSLYMGKKIGQMRRSKRPDLRAIALFMTIGLIFASVLLRLISEPSGGGGLGLNQPTFDAPQSQTLTIDSTTTTRYSVGTRASLMYRGEQGEIVTLRIIPPDGHPPSVAIISVSNGETDTRSIFPEGNIVEICGFELERTALYAFHFTANQTGDHRITFERGNTCDTDASD